MQRPDAQSVEAAPEAAPPSATDVAIEAWFVETFHGVPDLRVEHFNRFREAVDRLKARLRQKES